MRTANTKDEGASSKRVPHVIRHALAEALGVPTAATTHLETVDVKGAAALLHTTVAAVYTRRHAGKMPRPISKRPLVWRRADVLAMEDT